MTRRRLVTAKQAAAMTWEPWKKTADMWVPPSNPVWCNPLAPVVRIAWRTMFLDEGATQAAKERWSFLTHFDLSTIKNEAQLASII